MFKKIDPEDLLNTSDGMLVKRFPREVYGITRDELREEKRRARVAKKQSISEQVAQDRKTRKERADSKALKAQVEELHKIVDRLEEDNAKILALEDTIQTFRIEPKRPSSSSEATCVIVASDWHYEETVDPLKVSGLNEYNLDIAKTRAQLFFKSSLRLTNILAKDVSIKTIVLALLGDFISGDIHDEVAEACSLGPAEAIIRVQNEIASGIQFILDNSDYNLVIPCHSGNHARTTDTSRFSTENAHSWEFVMDHYLKMYFRDNPRVTFLIADGYHSYLQVYDTTIRFHHGHAVKYGGGVGGIYIPVNKAIAQWNKGRRADLDVFGHFHQSVVGTNFICNGSLIGYNSFALSIKADYEKPKQTLFLIDKKRGRTCVWPILVE